MRCRPSALWNMPEVRIASSGAEGRGRLIIGTGSGKQQLAFQHRLAMRASYPLATSWAEALNTSPVTLPNPNARMTQWRVSHWPLTQIHSTKSGSWKTRSVSDSRDKLEMTLNVWRSLYSTPEAAAVRQAGREPIRVAGDQWYVTTPLSWFSIHHCQIRAAFLCLAPRLL